MGFCVRRVMPKNHLFLGKMFQNNFLDTSSTVFIPQRCSEAGPQTPFPQEGLCGLVVPLELLGELGMNSPSTPNPGLTPAECHKRNASQSLCFINYRIHIIILKISCTPVVTQDALEDLNIQLANYSVKTRWRKCTNSMSALYA